jgi:hypothetical protein
MPTVSGIFDTRREAEMAIERLVQQHDVDRAAIRVAPVAGENSVGIDVAGSDAKRGEPIEPAGDEAALNGRIAVSLDREEADMATIRETFEEFKAADIRVG